MGHFYTKQEAIDIISNGGCVNFETENSKDYKYAENKGYKIECSSDCTYYCNKLPGISFSSWGDWGTIFGSELNDESKELIIEMINNDIYTTLYQYK